MRTISTSGLLRCLGISNHEWVFLTTAEVLKGVIQMKTYRFVKSPLVMNDIDNILERRDYYS